MMTVISIIFIKLVVAECEIGSRLSRRASLRPHVSFLILPLPPCLPYHHTTWHDVRWITKKENSCSFQSATGWWDLFMQSLSSGYFLWTGCHEEGQEKNANRHTETLPISINTWHPDIWSRVGPNRSSHDLLRVVREWGDEISLVSGPALRGGAHHLSIAAKPSQTLYGVKHPFPPPGLTRGSKLR